MVVSWVEPDMNAAVSSVMNIAGSASEPISISPRAPRPSNELPTSIAASGGSVRAWAEPALLQERDLRGNDSGRARHRQVEPVPVAVLDLERISGLRVLGAGQPAIRAVDRSEHVADRLAEGIRGVLHARRLLGIAAVPGIGEAQAAVVEAAYQQEREQSHGYDHDEKYHG